MLNNDQKETDKEGKIPTKMVGQARNLRSGIQTICYLGIKRIPEHNKAGCMSKTTTSKNGLMGN